MRSPHTAAKSWTLSPLLEKKPLHSEDPLQTKMNKIIFNAYVQVNRRQKYNNSINILNIRVSQRLEEKVIETSVSETETREIKLIELSPSVMIGCELKVLLLCHLVPPLFLHLSILEWWEMIWRNKNGSWRNWSREMKETNARRCSWAQHSHGWLWLNPAWTLWGIIWTTELKFPCPLSPIGEGFPVIEKPNMPVHHIPRRARFPEGRKIKCRFFITSKRKHKGKRFCKPL